jgi:hypothetical protein
MEFCEANTTRRTYGSPQVSPPESQTPNEPVSISVKRFLASLRFENKDKLDELRLEIDTNAIKSNN